MVYTERPVGKFLGGPVPEFTEEDREGGPPDGFYVFKPLPIVLCVARLVALKGHYVLLRASALLHGQDCPHFLELVGDGTERHDLEIFANDLGIRSTCWFRGTLPPSELPSIMRRAVVSVLPSIGSEGLGMVLIESQACGTPVIGSNIGGIPDAVAHGKSGYLVPPGDSQALADKIELFL